MGKKRFSGMTGCWWWRRLGFPLACFQIVAGPLRDSQGMVDRFTDCRNRSDAEPDPRFGIPLPAPQIVTASHCSIPLPSVMRRLHVVVGGDAVSEAGYLVGRNGD
jgi:hypothetical protein